MLLTATSAMRIPRFVRGQVMQCGFKSWLPNSPFSPRFSEETNASHPHLLRLGRRSRRRGKSRSPAGRHAQHTPRRQLPGRRAGQRRRGPGEPGNRRPRRPAHDSPGQTQAATPPAEPTCARPRPGSSASRPARGRDARARARASRGEGPEPTRAHERVPGSHTTLPSRSRDVGHDQPPAAVPPAAHARPRGRRIRPRRARAQRGGGRRRRRVALVPPSEYGIGTARSQSAGSASGAERFHELSRAARLTGGPLALGCEDTRRRRAGPSPRRPPDVWWRVSGSERRPRAGCCGRRGGSPVGLREPWAPAASARPLWLAKRPSAASERGSHPRRVVGPRP